MKALGRVLLAHKKWLQISPMDFRTFQRFCSNPDKLDYKGRDHLVIELFSERDFQDPPPELSLQCHVRNPVTDEQRIDLTTRGYDWLRRGSHIMLDQFIYQGMLEIWIKELRRLSESVEKVKVILKRPFSEEGWVFLPRMMVHTNVLLKLKGVLQDVDGRGRDVFGGILEHSGGEV
jgi:hypothetical protein